MMTETTVTVTSNDAPPSSQPAVKTDSGYQGQGALSWLKINIAYFKSIPGIIKIIQLLFGILCMALASPAYRSGTHWFLFVATVSFITTLIWVFVYLLSIREALKLPINWILTELLNTAMDTILYTIAFIVQLAVWADFYYWYRGANIAAGVFGILNALAYAAGTYFLYIEWKGTTTTTSSTTTAA
ncbi:plasmolipin [Anabrus simplex]|uniref:plasmolipin n=1 Tax=Anabrus simplex TaxID=316456 RepID=UPI0034DCE5AF